MLFSSQTFGPILIYGSKFRGQFHFLNKLFNQPHQQYKKSTTRQTNIYIDIIIAFFFNFTLLLLFTLQYPINYDFPFILTYTTHHIQINQIQPIMRLIFRSALPFTRYKVPYNINRQEHASYLKKVERAEKTIADSEKVQLVPRRKRRIYDRPRVDRNIEGYGAWRVYEQQQIIIKHNEHAMEVARKIMIEPKWLVHAFGEGAIPVSNPRSSHREYYFQDNRLNNYLLYEYRNTTHFRQNVQDYDYEHQQHLHPRVRIQRRLDPEQFWKSQQKFEFRLNTSTYAEKFKFQEWLLKEIEKRKALKSYDEFIDEKYGKVFSFNVKQQASKFIPYEPMVANVCPEHFNPKKGKQPEPKVKLGKKLEETFRIKQKINDFKEETKKQETQN